MNALMQTADSLIEVENAIIIPSATVDVDCKMTLKGKPTAFYTAIIVSKITFNLNSN